MARVILGTEHECYICAKPYPLERHHLYAGTRRQISERYGACVMLCPEHHRQAHHAGWISTYLKRKGQEALMRREGWTVDNFISEFGRSYL